MHLTEERRRHLLANQPEILLARLHRPAYRACVKHGNPKQAEEIRQLVLRVYSIDLATEVAKKEGR
jgi:hypothetical protein